MLMPLVMAMLKPMARARVMTGKATAPPPSEVAPPIIEPKIMVMDIL